MNLVWAKHCFLRGLSLPWGPARLSEPRQDDHCLGWDGAGSPISAVCSLYSLDVHAHHHAQGGVPCHGKVVPVVPQPDGLQPVLHCQTAGQVKETPVEARLGEPGIRTEGVNSGGAGPRWPGCEVHLKEPVTLQVRPGQKDTSQAGESRHAALWALLHVFEQTLVYGYHSGSKAVKCRMVPSPCPPQRVPMGTCMSMAAGKPLLLELDRNIPYSLQPTCSAQHHLTTRAHCSSLGSSYRFTVAVHFRLSGLRMSLSRMPTIWEKRGLSLRSFCQQSSMSWCRAVGQPMGAGSR